MVKKLFLYFILPFLLLGSVFSVSIDEVPTSASYSSSLFSFSSFTLDSLGNSNLYPYFVSTSGNFVFTPNHGIFHKTTTFQLAKKHLNNLNPVNEADGSYEASYIEVYRITPSGDAIHEKDYEIDPHKPILLSTDVVYRFDFYNYDLCSYMDANPSYEPADRQKADQCRFQGGTKHNAVQEQIFEQQQIEQQKIKDWARDSYDADSLKEPLKKYELQLEDLRAHYEACLSAWYMPYPFCLSIKKHYDSELSQYNSYVQKANNREAITRKSFDSNLENIKSQIQVFETKSTYYKELDKVQNDEKFKEKVENGDYDSDITFVKDNLDLIDQSLRKTVIDIEESKLPEGEFLSYTYEEPVPEKSKSKTIAFLVAFFLFASLIFLFNRVPFMRRYKSWGYLIGTIIIIVLVFI